MSSTCSRLLLAANGGRLGGRGGGRGRGAAHPRAAAHVPASAARDGAWAPTRSPRSWVTATAAYMYQRRTLARPLDTPAGRTALAVPSSALGALFAANVPTGFFRPVVMALLVGVALLVAVRPSFGVRRPEAAVTRRRRIAAVLLAARRDRLLRRGVRPRRRHLPDHLLHHAAGHAVPGERGHGEGRQRLVQPGRARGVRLAGQRAVGPRAGHGRGEHRGGRARFTDRAQAGLGLRPAWCWWSWWRGW